MVKKSVVVDSRDRDFDAYPSPGTYVVKLPQVFYNVVAARLVTAELPSSMYVFSSDCNNTTLKFILNNVPLSVVIPDGNYSYSSMAAALQTALRTATGTLLTVSISPTTGKTTIASPVGTDVLAVDATNPGNAKHTQWGLGWYLGFVRGVVASGTGTLTSPRIACMNPELSVFLDIPELGRVVETGIEGQGGAQSFRCFAKVPMAVNSTDYAYYDKLITLNEYEQPLAKLDRLTVTWRFHGDDEPLDFNFLEHSFTLELDCDVNRANQ